MPADGSSTTIAIAAREPLFVRGVIDALAAQPTWLCEGAPNSAGLLDHLMETAPDIALIDLGLDLPDVCSIIDRVTDAGVRVLALAASDGPGAASRPLKAGAAGYVSKHELDESTLLIAVNELALGRTFLSFEAQRALRDERFHRAESAAALSIAPLSPREQEILILLAAGRSTASIAAELHVSPSTIKTYLRRAYEKLGVSDRGAAIAAALRRQHIS